VDSFELFSYLGQIFLTVIQQLDKLVAMNEIKNLIQKLDDMTAALQVVQREQSEVVRSQPNSWIAGSVGPDGFSSRWLQDGSLAALIESAKSALARQD
jgi:hypothetical protein